MVQEKTRLIVGSLIGWVLLMLIFYKGGDLLSWDWWYSLRFSRPDVKISAPILSPDGNEIIFSYKYRNKYRRLAKYNLSTKEHAPLDLSQDLLWLSAAYSQDGNLLAAQTYCSQNCPKDAEGWHIALIDLSKKDNGYKILTKGKDIYREQPVFSPDSKEILFAQADASFSTINKKKRLFTNFSLSRIDLISGAEEDISPPSLNELSIHSYGNASYIGENEIVLSPVATFKNEFRPLSTTIRKMKLNPINGIAFKYNLGDSLEILSNKSGVGMGQNTAAYDGTYIFIDKSLSNPNLEGQYNFELFSFKDGGIRQLTKIESHLAAPYITPDSSLVVFLADDTRNRAWDIWLHDVNGGKTWETDIYEKIVEKINAEQDTLNWAQRLIEKYG